MFTANRATSVAISFSGENSFGIDAQRCLVKSLNITYHSPLRNIFCGTGSNFISVDTTPAPVEITIQLLCQPDDFKQFYNQDYTPKIRDKKIIDCTVEELLIAMKRKMEERNKGD